MGEREGRGGRDRDNHKLALAEAQAALAADVARLPSMAEQWIFAYGSLLWSHTGLDIVATRHAVLGGFNRRFQQASPDHRGTVESPGRVATLVAAPHACAAVFDGCAQSRVEATALALWRDSCAAVGGAPAVDGVATRDSPLVHGTLLKLNPHTSAATLQRLIVREQAGYTVLVVKAVCDDGGVCEAITFASAPDSCYLVRGEDEATTAGVIARAVGPSGPNSEYLARCVAAMRARGVHDTHIERLWVVVGAVVGDVEASRMMDDALQTIHSCFGPKDLGEEPLPVAVAAS